MNGHRQWHAPFGSDFDAPTDSLLDVLQGLFLGPALADAAGDRRTLGDENAVLVTVDGHDELHELHSKALRRTCPRAKVEVSGCSTMKATAHSTSASKAAPASLGLRT